MTRMRFRNVIIMLLILIISTACGPSDDGSSSLGSVGGGIGGTGRSFGQITGFGSIILNDTRFDISSAVTTVDGAVATEAELRLGDVCLVQGSIDTATASGTASSVRCDDLLEGVVTDVSNAANGVIVVMGRTVRVDVTTPTIFEDFNALEDLVVGNLVEVHGFLDITTGEIQATRIERKADLFTPDVSEVELKGTVSNFNGSDQFTIGGLTVQVVPTTEIEVNGGLADGKFVEVKGTLDAAVTLLTATKVEDEQQNPFDDATPGEEVEVEGIIHDFNGLADFKVNGISVNAANADIEDGAVADLANGVKVEVEGTRNAAGVLVAEEVEIKRRSRIRIEANVVGQPTATSLDVGVGPAVLSIQINTATELRDKTDSRPEPLQLTDILAGDRVKIRAFQEVTSGTIIATRIELRDAEDANDEVKLRGPIDPSATADPMVTILGVEIDTTGFSEDDFENDDDENIGRATFFNLIQTTPAPEAEAVDREPLDGTFDKIELKNNF